MLSLLLALALGQTPSLSDAIADGPMPIAIPDDPKPQPPKPEPPTPPAVEKCVAGCECPNGKCLCQHCPVTHAQPPAPPKTTPVSADGKAWYRTHEDGLVYGIYDGKSVTWLPDENPDAIARRAKAKASANPVKYTLIDRNGQKWTSADWNQLWTHVQTVNANAQTYNTFTYSNGVTFGQTCANGSCSAPARLGLFGRR